MPQHASNDNRSKKQLARMAQRIEVLERRNLSLRTEVERLTHGRPPAWTEFEQCDQAVFGDGRIIGHDGSYRVYLNSRYQVALFRQDTQYDGVRTYHLSIKRVDGAAIHDWRDFQRIKNELVGEEAEAVELYPAESRLVDGANQYHLFCVLGGRWPIGFDQRLVSEDNDGGVMQRPWPEGVKPWDVVKITPEALAQFAGLED
jgi:hypothetical protein